MLLLFGSPFSQFHKLIEARKQNQDNEAEIAVEDTLKETETTTTSSSSIPVASYLRLGNKMNDTLNLYATQNNTGVMRLREKRYLDAANCFCQAVQYVNNRRPSGTFLQDRSDSRDGACQNRNQDTQPAPESHSPLSSNTIGTSSEEHVPRNGSERDTSLPRGGNDIESFYLLLDAESSERSHNCDNSFDSQDSSSLCKDCQQTLNNDSSGNEASKENIASCRTSAECDETFVFKNPILVSHDTHGRTEQNPMVDRATRAKLSLISVYNMALTYHLAALDNDSSSNGPIRFTNNGDLIERRTRKRKIVFETLPTKRQKLSHSPTVTNTTTSTLVRDDESNERSFSDSPTVKISMTNTTKTATSISIPNQNAKYQESASVDRVLLGQALAYYQIAYRILVSEQRVLVSQAMVILNNIGHIHRLLGNEENAKKCFQRLLTTMLYLQQAGDHHQIIHWDSFLNNVMDVIISPEASHKRFAPAA